MKGTRQLKQTGFFWIVATIFRQRERLILPRASPSSCSRGVGRVQAQASLLQEGLLPAPHGVRPGRQGERSRHVHLKKRPTFVALTRHHSLSDAGHVQVDRTQDLSGGSDGGGATASERRAGALPSV